MKKVASVTLSRGHSPAFLPLSEAEVIKLRHVPAWMRWLYLELVGFSNFKTGAGSASWPRLVAMLDWDKPERGRRAAPEIGLQQVRRAFEQLAGLGLVARDKGRNEAQGMLFFHVSPRAGIGAPKDKTDRVSDRGGRARKPSKDGASSGVERGIPTGFPTGGSPINTKTDSTVAELSTSRVRLPSESTPPTKAAKVLRDTLKARAARGDIKAPQGGQTVAPSGHTPPGASPPESAQADSSPRRTAINSPPRGGNRPPGGAAAVGDLLAGLRARTG